MEHITLEEKIFGLSLFWQEAKYNFAYFDNLSALNWDQSYLQFLSLVIESKSDFDYYRILEKFAALLQDGHTRIVPPQEILELLGTPKILLKNFNEQVFISNTDCTLTNKLPIGSEIIKINNFSTREYINKTILPYVACSTDIMRWQLATRDFLLSGKLEDKLALTIKTPDNNINEVLVTRSHKNDLITWHIPPDEPADFSLSWINNSIAYLKLSHFDNRSIVDNFISSHNKLLQAEAIILDLRDNVGGNSLYAFEIAHYFSNDPIKEVKEFTRINNASKKAHGILLKNYPHLIIDDPSSESEKEAALEHCNGVAWQRLDSIEYNNKYKISEVISAPLVLLTNINTASAAEDFLIYLDSVNRGTRMGQATTGSSGTPILIELPAGGTGLICSKKCTFPDGRRYVGLGIQPHIIVENALLTSFSKEDPCLRKAKEILIENLSTNRLL